jgi:integrase
VLTLVRSSPAAGKQFTDSGQVHDDRGLKHRGDDEPRTVPIPPELVAILRWHIDTIGVGADGRLFRSGRGNPVGYSTFSRVWQDARLLALPPAKAASPLAARPYDLRHGWRVAVAQCRRAGARGCRPAGHSVDVLLKVYAKCLDGDREIMNARIEQALVAQ